MFFVSCRCCLNESPFVLMSRRRVDESLSAPLHDVVSGPFQQVAGWRLRPPRRACGVLRPQRCGRCPQALCVSRAAPATLRSWSAGVVCVACCARNAAGVLRSRCVCRSCPSRWCCRQVRGVGSRGLGEPFACVRSRCAACEDNSHIRTGSSWAFCVCFSFRHSQRATVGHPVPPPLPLCCAALLPGLVSSRV